MKKANNTIKWILLEIKRNSCKERGENTENIYTYMIDGTKSSRKPFHYCTLATIEKRETKDNGIEKVINIKTMYIRKFGFIMIVISKNVTYDSKIKIVNLLIHVYFMNRNIKFKLVYILINKAAVIDVQDTWENDMSVYVEKIYFNNTTFIENKQF